jgi:hypothetical protein
MRADLHLHSTLSDGSAAVGEIVLLARAAGLRAISVTDHDCIFGTDLLKETASRYGLIGVPGIEVSAYDFDRGRKVHVLGYGIEGPARPLEQLCAPLRERRHAMTIEFCGILAGLGYPVSADSVAKAAAGAPVLYKQHIMKALMEAGSTDSVYGSLYKSLFKGGGPCSTDIRYVDAREAVRAVRESYGIAVLAHPAQTDSFDLIPALIDAGLQGIEVRHPDHGPAEEARAREAAERYSLLVSGGSDWHGSLGDEGSIGSHGPDSEIFSALGISDQLTIIER